MIAIPLGQIAEIVGGTLAGPADLIVPGPAFVDSRKVQPGGLFVAIAGEKSDGHEHVPAAIRAGAVAVLAGARVDAPAVLVDDPTTALAKLAQWTVENLRANGGLTVIALTGSQGKTSVKDLVGHVLETQGPTVFPEGSFNNELGVPLTMLRADAATRWLVLEMGARGIGHISYLCSLAPPDVGAVLNVGSAHLGEFGSVENIAQAKAEIIENLAVEGTAVLSADDERVLAATRAHKGEKILFGYGSDAHVQISHPSLDDLGHPRFDLTYEGETWPVVVPQIGFHHAINAAAAFALTRAAGIEPNQIVSALATATPRSAMRMETSRTQSGTLVINDAYNANPESMAAALRTLAEIAPERSVAVLGPMLELGTDSDEQHAKIGELATSLGIDRVIVVGEIAAPIAGTAGNRGEFFGTVEDAVDALKASLLPTDTVLVKASRSIGLEKLVEQLLPL